MSQSESRKERQDEMATKTTTTAAKTEQRTAERTIEQQSVTEMKQGDELARIKAERAALDAQYKALMAQQKAKRAVAKAAQRTKTLETVISEEETAMARWMVARLLARVNARVKAGQDRETALDAVLANFRRVLGTQLDRRAK